MHEYLQLLKKNVQVENIKICVQLKVIWVALTIMELCDCASYNMSCYMTVVSSISHSVSTTVCTGWGESGEADVCMGRGASGEEGDVTCGGEVGRGGIIKLLAAYPSPVGNSKLVLTMAVRSLAVGSPSSSSLFSAVLKSISTV